MKKLFLIFCLVLIISNLTNINAQYTIAFGGISDEDLLNKPYKPDPGADAIILAETGIARLEDLDDIYVHFEKNVKIRIVNNNGFDYADIEVPFSAEDELIAYKATSYNMSNGTMKQTVIPKDQFIIEKTSKYRKTLKFNFPDVHEGTIVEYSYILRMKDDAVYVLTPWEFQKTIPVVKSSLTTVIPEFFVYKTLISGDSRSVRSEIKKEFGYFGSYSDNIVSTEWSASNIPAFEPEPQIKNVKDNLTKITFELGRVNFPDAGPQIVSPTYQRLTKELLEDTQFGYALERSSFLKKYALEVTKGMTDDISKIKAIHRFVTERILWNGEEDFLVSDKLSRVFAEGRGNNADINMILISMLRAVNIKAEPVILSTRSNGSINVISAMLQQFNYLVANVYTGTSSFLVDATDKLRPFNLLPHECLSGVGRQISATDSKFVELKNAAIDKNQLKLYLALSPEGNISGNLTITNHGYPAYDVRNSIKLEGQDGYSSLLKAMYSHLNISDISFFNITEQDSDVIEKFSISMKECARKAGNIMIFNPFLSYSGRSNIFISPERNYPVDYGSPENEEFILRLKIPAGFTVQELPGNVTYELEKNGGKYEFTSSIEKDEILFRSSMFINKTQFDPSEYNSLRDFYTKMLNSQTRMVILKEGT